MHYTFESNKIYPVIKAGKKYLKKVDHFAPVSPIGQVWYLIVSILDLVFLMLPILNENSESNLVRPAKEVHALEG